MGNCFKYLKAILDRQRNVSDIRELVSTPGEVESETQTPLLLGFADDEEQIKVSNIHPKSATVGDGELEEDRAAPAPSPSSSITLQDCINLFDAVKDSSNIDSLIHMIKELLQREKSKKQYKPDNGGANSEEIQKIESWTSFTKTGSVFLNFLNEHVEKIANKENLDEGTKVAMEILQRLEKAHWVVAGLSMTAYLSSKIDKVSENRTECLQLLECMIELAQHLRNMKNMTAQEEEKFTNAIQLIVEGSITCASRIDSNKIFRFIKTSVNSEGFTNLRRKISKVYHDLVLITVIGRMKPMEEQVLRRYHYVLPIQPPVSHDKQGYYSDEDGREY